MIWVVYAAYLHARATSGWSTSKAAYLALAGYGCILINYMIVNVYFVGTPNGACDRWRHPWSRRSPSTDG